ncbi:vacuolar protein sorting protein DigA [Aspergillus bombycis]|uniref:Vacuolar protein sorting protein DigA n=1 Tax=Aspergillus bombycis TaxID=109264 RepID=A0A1F7ZY70_9EURO|nr:vacuolar protein sorting protein DigA [Aspergillus bombycis]OGM44423.1 vacuolar protein sorting protein DigA [Aspergillus bombycis]
MPAWQFFSLIHTPQYWMRFDDLAAERVTLVDIERALKHESPYLLFYQILPVNEDAAAVNLPDTAPSSEMSDDAQEIDPSAISQKLSTSGSDLPESCRTEGFRSNRPSFEITAPDNAEILPLEQNDRKHSVAFSDAVESNASGGLQREELLLIFSAYLEEPEKRTWQSRDKVNSDGFSTEDDEFAVENMPPGEGAMSAMSVSSESNEKSPTRGKESTKNKGKSKEKRIGRKLERECSVINLTETPDSALFDVRRVQLQFPLAADFVAAQVANNVLILALATNRILRIDLEAPEDIDDIDLPKKSSEIGVIRRMFLDPSASHLIITTTLGENYYLHTQSRQPKPLSRLKGVSIESIAWNPSLPTASTREILLGTTDGHIYEAYIEPSTEFYRREERYVTTVYKVPEASPVTGLWAELVQTQSEQRRVLIATHSKLIYVLGRTGRHGREGGGSIYIDLFQRETPLVYEAQKASNAAPSALAISPNAADGNHAKEFAWLSSQGVYHGQLPYSSEKVNQPFETANMLPRSFFPATESARGGKRLIQNPITAMTLSQWHILALVEGRVIAVNRMNEEIVYDQAVLEPAQSTLGLLADSTQHTYWLFTNQEIFEIAVEDEDRDIWKVFLQKQMFDEALHYARSSTQKDVVSTASGDFLASKGRYQEAAKVWGKSSKGFEEVCLTLINGGEHDALRKYLLGQLSTYKKSSSMQRVMVASWLVEVFMTKLNSLDDNIATSAEVTEGTSTEDIKGQLSGVRSEFQEFVTKYKSDLDKKTVYGIISSHGREEELLYFATAVSDHNYVLSYWIQREKWPEALNVLQRQSDPDVFYKYSSVLMTHAATGLVDILMRQTNLDPEKLIPALLNYNKMSNVPLNQNQAVRYLNFIIVNHPKPSPAVHNTLISIHALSISSSEAGLLTYLQSQASSPPPYDADFALRLCIQHQRFQSCIHIYSAMGQYLQAVELALQHEDIELAAIIADRPEGNDKLRKKLWLLVAEKKIQQPGTGIKDAIEFLRRCELLRIEDLIPFFPDFVVIDDFKDEICSALEDYSRHIDALRQEMDNSAHTARQIRTEIAALDMRYAIVEPGEKCWLCSLPVLSRQFFVFPCQHAFHSDCLGKEVLEGAGGKRNILCGDHALKHIDKPFITANDAADDWAL